MSDSRKLVKEAVEDARSIKELALESAKKELLESITPGLKELLEKALKGEGVNRLRRGMVDKAPGESHTGFEESKEKGDQPMEKEMKHDKHDDKELDMEALASFFPQFGEAAEADHDEEHVEEADGMGAIPTLGEAEDEEMKDHEEPHVEAKKHHDDEEENMDEEIEISESELRKVYDASLKMEVQVKKGFGEMSKSGELAEVDPAAGIADVKKGEHAWEKEEPSAHEDFSVKEAIKLGMEENKMLRTNLKKAIGMIESMGKKLHEVNLFNSKVLHVNRILNAGRLTKEQKQVVMESIDKARTISEVKTIYETLTESFKASAAPLSETRTRKPAANAQRARTSGAPDQKVLRESVDHKDGDAYARLKLLAGLVK